MLLDGEKVISGKLDVLEELRRIPEGDVRDMQRSIAAHAHAIHYALEDAPGDAVEVLLYWLTRRTADGLRWARQT